MSKIDRVQDCVMTNSKLTIGVGLATASLALFLANAIGGRVLLGSAGLAAMLGISAMVLAAAAFAISWKQRSFLVAALLAAGGITFMSSGLIALARMNFEVIEFPGPIFGVMFGLAIVGLGVARGIRTVRTTVVAAR
jgi:hypothetical protein